MSASIATHPLRSLRHQRGASLQAIAAEVGTFHPVVLRWEQNRGEPSPQFRQAYAKALGITIEQLGAIIYACRAQGD